MRLCDSLNFRLDAFKEATFLATPGVITYIDSWVAQFQPPIPSFSLSPFPCIALFIDRQLKVRPNLTQQCYFSSLSVSPLVFKRQVPSQHPRHVWFRQLCKQGLIFDLFKLVIQPIKLSVCEFPYQLLELCHRQPPPGVHCLVCKLNIHVSLVILMIKIDFIFQ